jgi:VWFA-related protein
MTRLHLRATRVELPAPSVGVLALALLALVLALVLLLVSALPVGAQGNVTVTLDNVVTTPDGNTVAYVTVRDENGVPILGLEPANFNIVEDQSTYFPPQEVGTQVNPAAGMRVALVLDLSGTMKDQPLEEAKKASARLLELLLNEPNDPDRAAFFGINGPVNIGDLTVHEGEREADFTNDRNKILNLINPLQVSGSASTPLYDALFRVAKIAGRQQGPRAVIVITDGQDKVSSLSADDPISEANRNHIPIFPVGFSQGPVNDAYLTRLAARTGATYTKARAASGFTKGFEDILSQLSQQYVLTYKSQIAPDGKPHALVVQVTTPKGKETGERVFIGPVPTAAPTPVPVETTATVAALAAEPASVPIEAPTEIALAAEPTPEPAPAVEQTLVQRAKDWVLDRSNWPILIAVLAGLLLLVALILFFVLRNPRGAEQAYEQPVTTGSAIEPITTENRASTGPTTTGGAAFPPPDTTTAGGTAWHPPPSAPPPPVRPVMEDAGYTRQLPRIPPPPKVLAILINRKQTQERYDITASTEIGRATDNQIVLQSTTVSRKHAKIWEEKGQFKIHDLVSANGTFVNDKRIREPVLLKNGDVVRFGETEFLFRILIQEEKP